MCQPGPVGASLVGVGDDSFVKSGQTVSLTITIIIAHGIHAVVNEFIAVVQGSVNSLDMWNTCCCLFTFTLSNKIAELLYYLT